MEGLTPVKSYKLVKRFKSPKRLLQLAKKLKPENHVLIRKIDSALELYAKKKEVVKRNNFKFKPFGVDADEETKKEKAQVEEAQVQKD